MTGKKNTGLVEDYRNDEGKNKSVVKKKCETEQGEVKQRAVVFKMWPSY